MALLNWDSALRSPFPAKLLLLALCCGLFLGPSAQAQWISLGPDGGDARSLALDPTDPDRIYLGTTSGQLYLSTDNGMSWSLLAKLGETDDYVLERIAVDPSNPKSIFAASWRLNAPSGEIFHSRDRGKTWQAIESVRGKSMRAVAIAPSNPRVLVAGGLDGVYLSDDGGNSFHRISPEGHPDINNLDSVAIDPQNLDVIYAGTWHLPWKTTDGGKDWHNIKKGLIDDSDVFSIIVDPINPTLVYASACSGIYKSENGGEQFHKVQGIPSTARRTYRLAQDPLHSDVVYAATTMGLWKTADAGSTWKNMTGPSIIVHDVIVDPRDPQHLLLATDRGGIMVSHDAGVSFAPSNIGFVHRQVAALVVDRHSGNTLYAGLVNDKEYGGVFLSHDGGAHWSQLSQGLGGRDVFSLRQSDRGDLIAGTNRGIFVLEQSSGQWRPLNVVISRAPRAPRPVRSQLSARVSDLEMGPGKWYAATSSGLFTSTDRGRIWRGGPVLGERDLLAVGAAQRMIVVAGWTSLLVSSDGGATWSRSLLPEYITAIHSLMVDKDSDIWLATSAGLYVSRDHGQNWQHIANGIAATSAESVSYDEPGNRLLATSSGSSQIYASNDGGHRWSLLADVGQPVRAVVTSGGRLFAVTPFDGILSETSVSAREAPGGGSLP